MTVLRQEGGALNRVLVLVDGHNHELLALLRLLNVCLYKCTGIYVLLFNYNSEPSSNFSVHFHTFLHGGIVVVVYHLMNLA